MIQLKHASWHACTICAWLNRAISQPNWVGSERSKYIGNQVNMPDLSEHIIWPNHTNQHTCKLYSCMYIPRSWPIFVRFLWNHDYFPYVYTYSRGQTPQEETKALKNPSAGDRKRGPWEPQYSSIFIILVKSLSLMKLTLSYNSLMFFLLKIFSDLLK